MKILNSQYWLLIIAFYFLAHVVVRVSLGAPLTEEEALLLENAADLRLSYDGFSPLYLWMQHGLFALLGPGLLAISLLKNLILFATCAFVNRLVNEVAGRDVAWLATLSLAFMPQIIWNSQHEMTGTVLATCMGVMFVWALMRLFARPNFMNTGIFALTTFAGLMSAPGIFWVILAAGLATATTARYRRTAWRAAIITFLALIIALPLSPLMEGLTLLVERIPALASTLMSGKYVITRAGQMYELLAAGAAFVGILVIGVGYTLSKGMKDKVTVDVRAVELREYLARMVAIGFVFVLVAVAVGLIRDPDVQAIQPLLVLFAPLVTLYLYPLLHRQAEVKFLRAAGIVLVAVLILTPTYHKYDVATDIAGDKTAPTAAVTAQAG